MEKYGILATSPVPSAARCPPESKRPPEVVSRALSAGQWSNPGPPPSGSPASVVRPAEHAGGRRDDQLAPALEQVEGRTRPPAPQTHIPSPPPPTAFAGARRLSASQATGRWPFLHEQLLAGRYSTGTTGGVRRLSALASFPADVVAWLLEPPGRFPRLEAEAHSHSPFGQVFGRGQCGSGSQVGGLTN